MKKLLTTLFVFAFGATMLTACGSPCDRTWDKMKKCAKGDIEKKLYDSKEMKKLFVESCKKADKGKIKKCLKHGDCKKFQKCVSGIK